MMASRPRPEASERGVTSRLSRLFTTFGGRGGGPQSESWGRDASYKYSGTGPIRGWTSLLVGLLSSFGVGLAIRHSFQL